MSHAIKPFAENDETYHEISRAALSDGALARPESAPAAPRVLARDDATFDGVANANANGNAAGNGSAHDAAQNFQPMSAGELSAPAPANIAAAPRVEGAVNLQADLSSESAVAARVADVSSDATVAAWQPRVLAPPAQNSDATLAPGASFSASQSEEPSLLENGAQLGPYQVQAHLGDGGMASVYRVWHSGLHRVEALKVPRQQGRFGPEAAFLRRLLAEARTVANLQHPNIAAIHAISDAASPLQFFSMEFVEGGDVATLLAEQKNLAPSIALLILEQVAAALDYAHSQNVIHRDIKPANILLQKSGENMVAKVVDFGISRAGEEAGATRLTRSGMIVGTPEYMSPEQSGSGDDVTARTDEYSLGVLAYEMLCGAPPFVAGEGVSRLSLLMKHVGEIPQTPAHRVSGLPVAASDAIIKALSKKPEKRFASCCEFVAALREGLAGHDGIAPAPISGSTAPSRHTRVFESATTTLQAAPPEAIKRARFSALLAGVGGLVAGVALVFGVLGYGKFPVQPLSLPSSTAEASSVVKPPREYSQAPARIVVQREIIPFATETRAIASLKKGVKREMQPGRAGTREVRLKISVKNGMQDVQRGAAKIIVAPRARIVGIGSAENRATKKIAPVKAAALSTTPSNAASPRVAASRARATTTKRALKKRVAQSPGGQRTFAEKRDVPRHARSRRVAAQPKIRRRVVRLEAPLRRRKSVRHVASTRSVKRAAPRRSSRAFAGLEAGLPP